MNSLPAWRQWTSLAILIAAYALSFVDRQILSLLVDPIKQDLLISDTQMGLLQGLAFALFYSLLGLPIGRLADRYSRRNIISLGIAFWSAMTGVCGMASSYVGLFVARMGVGVGEAALSPAAQSLITDIFPRERLGIAQSLYATAIAIGGGLAFMIGGWVASTVADLSSVVLPLFGSVRGWQAAFLLVALPGLVLAPLVLFLPEPARPVRKKTNFGSDIRELGSDRTLFLRTFLGVACLTAVAYANVSWLPTVLIRVHAWTLVQTGLSYGAVMAVFGTLGLVFGGVFADWRARQHPSAHLKVASIAAFALIVPATLTPLAPNGTLILVGIAATVFCGAIPSGGIAAMIQIAAPSHLRATMVALVLLTQNLLGLTFGPLLVGVLTDHLFSDPLAVGKSLAIVNVAATSLGAVLLASALPPYRRILRRQELSL